MQFDSSRGHRRTPAQTSIKLAGIRIPKHRRRPAIADFGRFKYAQNAWYKDSPELTPEGAFPSHYISRKHKAAKIKEHTLASPDSRRRRRPRADKVKNQARFQTIKASECGQLQSDKGLPTFKICVEPSPLHCPLSHLYARRNAAKEKAKRRAAKRLFYARQRGLPTQFGFAKCQRIVAL